MKINAVRPKGSQRNASGQKKVSGRLLLLSRRTYFGAIFGPFWVKKCKKIIKGSPKGAKSPEKGHPKIDAKIDA